MVSRRKFLHLGAGALAATAGCLGDRPAASDTPDDDSKTPTTAGSST
jgi:hypothetical protein